MGMETVTFRTGHGAASGSERDLRIQLAAAYRCFAMWGYTETIFNHITVRLPGEDEHFLINPFGLLYEHVTASNLVKIDVEGHPLEPTPFPVNPAGFIIHAAIHRAGGADNMCVIHTHTPAGMAVAQLECGLLHNNFLSMMMYNRVAYHDFQGITIDAAEQDSLVRSLGNKPYLILRNHGLLVTGRSVGEAVHRMFNLEKACQIQLQAMATGERQVQPSREILERVGNQCAGIEEGSSHLGDSVLAALMRKLDQTDPSYRD